MMKTKLDYKIGGRLQKFATYENSARRALLAGGSLGISLSRTYIFLSCSGTILKFRDQSRKFVPLSFSFSRTYHRVNVDVLFDALILHTKICKAFNK